MVARPSESAESRQIRIFRAYPATIVTTEPITDMPSQAEQAALNVEEARALREAGLGYRDIRRRLGLSPGQLAHVRRALKREKAACTRLRKAGGGASYRDLPVSQSILPKGLRRSLTRSGFATLGDLADRIADPDLSGLEALAGIGPHRARLVKGLLDHFGLWPGPSDLQARIEQLFPEFRD